MTIDQQLKLFHSLKRHNTVWEEKVNFGIETLIRQGKVTIDLDGVIKLTDAGVADVLREEGKLN